MTAAALPLARAGDAPGVWRRHLSLLGVISLALLLLFARDAADMARIWWTSSTFGHCLFVLPIIAWLVWQRKDELVHRTPRAWLPGLLLVGAGAFGWLLGDAAGVALARHLGLVLMLQGTAIAILGPAAVRGLAFPIAYALFLVPFGEELVPPLQTLTAAMCMALLGLAGVPAQIDGVFITIPNGWFEVAEACSGVKFLIAMIAYGALAAHVCFRSWRRRALFMAAAIAAPILANGVRAWGTIYISWLTDTRFASGFDHVVYGWFFFAFVLGLLMLGAWPFFDHKVRDPWLPAEVPVAPAAHHPPALAAMLVLLLALAPVAWGSAIASAHRTTLPDRIALPEIAGWRRVPVDQVMPWGPHFSSPDHSLIGRYSDAHGRTVDLAIIVYADQHEGRELVGYGQGAIDPQGVWAWTSDRPSPPSGRAFRISAPGPVVREVATFYRVGHVTTGSDARVKLETLRVRLLGGPRRAVAVMVSAVEPGGEGSARPAIQAFLTALGPVDRLADRLSTR